MDGIDSELFQNSIRYLHNVSTLPETNIPALKSFICLKRRLMELRSQAFLPSNATKPYLHCPRCFLNFFDGPASYKMKSKLKEHNFAKKLINKQKNKQPLTRYQEEYLKRNNKFNGGYLVITCKFCKFESKIKMHRPPPQKKVKLTEISVKKKKKKNKKDKFCGLNENVVLSITPNKSTNNKNDSVIFVGPEEPQTPLQLKKKKIKKVKHKNDSDIICLDSDDSKTPQKLKKKKQPLVTYTQKSIICLDSDDSTTPQKLKKKQQPLVTSTPKPAEIRSSLSSKKNKKAREKLSDILKKSPKKNKPSNLLSFLQSL